MSVLDWFKPLLGGGDPEAQGAAQASTAMQPAVLDHLQNILADAKGLQSTYDPSRSFRENVLDPRAVDQAMNIALGFGPGAIRAFHGSPFDFARFDMRKIGTGEGHQIKGHGLYFTEPAAMAESYRGVQGNAGANPAANVAQKSLLAGHDPVTSLRAIFPKITDDEIAQAIATAKAPPSGKVYEVDINAEPEAFLHLDKPMSGQSPAVQKAIQDTVPWGADYVGTSYAPMLAGNAEMAARLRDAGLPGFSYPNGGPYAGTRGYVVFDDKLIDILRKYGIAGPAAVGLGAGAYGQGSDNF